MTRIDMTLRMTLALLIVQSLSLATTPPLADLDLNKDGYVNGADAVLLLEGISAPEQPGADVDNNGAVDHRDLTLFLQTIAKVGWGARAEPVDDGWTETIDGWVWTPPMPDERGGWDWCFIPDPFGGGYGWCEGGGGDDDEGGPGGFEPPDDGGGGGDDDDGGGTSCECECGSVDIQGPNYVGVGQTIGFSFWRPGGTCRPRNSRVVVTSGQGLLVSTYQAGMSPGTVNYRWVFELCGGEIVCSATHTVRIREYDEIDFRYMAFIECQVIPLPAQWLTSWLTGMGWFGGDDRWFDADPPPGNWRARIDLTFRMSDFAVGGPAYLGQALTPPVFGTSTGYASAAAITNPAIPALQCPTSLVPGAAPSGSATLAPDGANAYLTITRVGSSPTTVLATSNILAGIPLVPVAPPIRSHLRVQMLHRIDPEDGSQFLDYSILPGSYHSRFPSHDFYLASQNPWGFSHTNAMNPTGPLDITLTSPIEPFSGTIRTSP